MGEDISRIHWQPVIQALYNGGFVERGSEDERWDYEIYDPLEKDEVGLSRQEIEFALRYLKHNDLIRENEDGRMALTETGLQIAYDQSVQEQERSARRRQEAINRTIMLAAIVTALSSVITMWPPETAILSIPSWANALVVSGGIVFGSIVLFVLLVEFWKLEIMRVVSIFIKIVNMR